MNRFSNFDLRFTMALVVVLGAGCSGIGFSDSSGPTDTQTPPETASTVQPPSEFTRDQPVTDNIDSALDGIVNADNRSRYAAAHGLDYRDGRVLVVIELVPNGSIPADYDVRIEHRVVVEDGVVVQAYLDVDAIGPFVREPAVQSIRIPESPSTVG